MLKLNRRTLLDVFTGWMNFRARDIANDLGTRGPDAYSISLVQQALAKALGMRERFQTAALGYRVSNAVGTVGQAYKPFLLSREPR